MSIAIELEAAGFTRAQAEVQANIFQRQMELQLRYKDRLQERIYSEMTTRTDLQEATYEFLKWLITCFMANAALVISVLAYLK